MKQHILLIATVLSVVNFSWAGQNNIQLLKDSVTLLQRNEGHRFKIQVETESALTGLRQSSEGHLFVHQGRLRWEVQSSTIKSLIVLDGTYLWVLQQSQLDNELPPQVTKTDAKKLAETHRFFQIFLGKQDLSGESSIQEIQEKDPKITAFELKNETEDYQIYIQIDKKDKKIKELVYTDDLKNKTKITFLKYDKLSRAEKKIQFSFKIPKGAEVTVL